MPTKQLYELRAEAPFLPQGVTLSIQCDASGVEMWASMLPRIAAYLKLGAQFDKPEPEPALPPEMPAGVTDAPIPDGVLKYAQSWAGADDWLAEDIVERFKRLRRSNGNNDELAYQELLKMDGEK